MTKSIRSYPSIYNLGHRAAAGILDGLVAVQEKVDGSQFSFAASAENPRIPVCRSKGAEIQVAGLMDKLFRPAVETAVTLAAEGKLVPGWTYRGETLAKPKHNTMAYGRVPVGNVILFDIDRAEEDYVPLEPDEAVTDLYAEAALLGLEAVPTFFCGHVASLDQVRGFLERESVLGGAKIEGVVIKAYGQYGPDKKTLMAKYVSEAFKEVHSKDWKTRNPAAAEIVQLLTDKYRSPARWQKAVQHLREAGALQEAVQDIGPLMKEVARDVFKEEKEAIASALFDYAWPKIARGVTAGLPQWYKDELANAAFPASAPLVDAGKADA